MKKLLLLTVSCLTLLAANMDARFFFGGRCGRGGCAVKACVRECAPACEARECWRESCNGPCEAPVEEFVDRHIEYRKCIMLVPQESTYPVEVVCTTTKRCRTTECPIGACGETPSVFSDGSPIESNQIVHEGSVNVNVNGNGVMHKKAYKAKKSY